LTQFLVKTTQHCFVLTENWVKYGSTKCWVKYAIKILQLKVKVEDGLKFEITFLTQHLGLSMFYPNLG